MDSQNRDAVDERHKTDRPLGNFDCEEVEYIIYKKVGRISESEQYFKDF